MTKRNTIQRIKIIDFLKSVKTHPSAETVYEAVRKNLPTISLATVYRNLNMMAEEGQILKLEINNEFRFDGDTCSHQHCVCSNCNKIVDVFNKKISDYAMKNVKSDMFEPQCVQIIYKGICKDCS